MYSVLYHFYLYHHIVDKGVVFSTIYSCVGCLHLNSYLLMALMYIVPTVGSNSSGRQPADWHIPLPGDSEHRAEEEFWHSVPHPVYSVWRRGRHRRQEALWWKTKGRYSCFFYEWCKICYFHVCSIGHGGAKYVTVMPSLLMVPYCHALAMDGSKYVTVMRSLWVVPNMLPSSLFYGWCHISYCHAFSMDGANSITIMPCTLTAIFFLAGDASW